MGFYEVYPSVDINYYQVRLSLFLGKYFEGIYYHDPKTQTIRIFLRTEANANTLRQFFSVKETSEDELPIPRYVAEVMLKSESDFYAPIRYHDLSSFVLELPEGCQVRIWMVYDETILRALRWKFESSGSGNKRLTTPQQVASSLIKGPIYLVKIYLMCDKRSQIEAMVNKLANFVVPLSGVLAYKLVKVPKKKKKGGLLQKLMKKLLPKTFRKVVDQKANKDKKKDEKKVKRGWVDKMPNVKFADLLTELKLWTWATDDDINMILTFPKTGKVKLASSNALPHVRYDRKDFLIGRDIMYDEDVYLDWTDFQRHALILGSTGSGKSNTLEILAQELMKYGLVVFVDPNSQSARKLSKLAKYYFTIGGPNQDPNFGINVLKIPPYFKNRDEAIDYVVGKAEQLFKKMLNLTDNAVYVSFVVKVVLRALLKRYDEITFEDFYETLLALWNEEIDINELLSPEDKRTMSELEFLNELQSQTFASVLARLENFVNNRKFRIITAQKTIDWDRIMEETGGKGLVVFDVTKGENEDLAITVMGLIAIDLFNYVFLRDALKREPKPIFLIVDEAHNITHFDFITLIFKEARKYGLHLILATQSFSSIINTAGAGNAAEINNNANVKIIMKVNDALEAEIITKAVGGVFANDIKPMLSQLGIGQAFLFLMARPGEFQVPKLIQIRKSELQLSDEVEPTKGFEPKLSRIPKVGHPIRMFFMREYPFTPLQQLILFKVHANGGQIDQPTLLKETGIDRDKLGMEIQRLETFIQVAGGEKGTTKVFVLKDPSWVLVGLKPVVPSKEGMMIAVDVIANYIDSGFYVVPARQSPDLKYRPDLVAVKMLPGGKLNYDENIAIEIETPNELSTSPQQVAKNMRKYADQDMQLFKEVHFWTTEDAFPKLKEIYDKFMEDPSVPDDVKKKVRIFALQVEEPQPQQAQQQENTKQGNTNKQQTKGQAQGQGQPQQKPKGQPQQVSEQQTNTQASESQDKPQTQGQRPIDPAEEIQVDGKTIKIYKYSSAIEIDGKRLKIPPFETKRLLNMKDSIASIELVADGKKIVVKYKDGTTSEILPASA